MCYIYFQFRKNLHSDLNSGWTNLYSHRQRINVPSPHIHASTCCHLACLTLSQSDRSKIKSQNCFLFALPWQLTKDAGHFLKYFLAICISYENSVQFHTPVINWFFEFFIYSRYSASVRYTADKGFSPFSGLPFHLNDGVFCCTEDFLD